MDLEPFFYYFVFTKTLNLSNEKCILPSRSQYSPINIYQRIYVTGIVNLYNMGSNILVTIHINGTRSNLLLFCVHQDTDTEKQEKDISIASPIFI